MIATDNLGLRLGRFLRGGTPTTGRVRLRTLLLARWLAILGQVATVVAVQFGFGFALPLDETLAAIVASVVLNLVLTIARPAVLLGGRGIAALLGWDVAQLGLLLQFTGGLANPFAILLVAPVAIAAVILSRRATLAVGLLALATASALTISPSPLPWAAPGLEFPRLYVVGIWAALVTGMGFIAIYAASVVAETRQVADALAATQMALERERRLSALGALAAAAAHELGTPLGTIAVAAREVARELPANSPVAEDVQALLAETQRCREILTRLAARPVAENEGPLARPLVSALVEAAARPHRRAGVEIVQALDGAPPAPTLADRPELVPGLGALIENAVGFARARVELTTRWTGDEIAVMIADDGPGFAPGVLDRLGEPYLSSRPETGESLHMGLGVFIAKTLLERAGAELEFANRAGGGALVTARWRRP